MELNAVEQYLQNNSSFASIRVLCKKLNLKKSQIKRLIFQSTHLKAVSPLMVGSGKTYLPIFEYHEYSDSKEYFKRRKELSIRKKKTIIAEAQE